MKNTRDKKKLKLLWGDYVTIGLISALAVLLFAFSFAFSGEGLVAEIYLEGELVERVSLQETEKQRIVAVGGCELLLEKDSVSFQKSLCEDKLCIKRGRLLRHGDSMACVPQRVAVVLKGEKAEKIHGITY